MVPLVVNRCLFALALMQITIMGALALKSADLKSDSNGWSEYAKIVLSITPLLFCTYLVYNMLDQAYLRQCSNIPLEIFGKLERESSLGELDDDELNDTEMTPMLKSPRQRDFSHMDDLSNSIEIGETYNPLHSVLETPMTRVRGVLDKALFPNEMEGERELDTYLHPALIGRLPIFWIHGSSFDHLRKQQVENQSIILNRHNYRQRAVREPVDYVNDSRLQWFFEGLMNWIHRLIS